MTLHRFFIGRAAVFSVLMLGVLLYFFFTYITQGEKTEMRLYFGVLTEIEKSDCAAVGPVIRMIPLETATLDTAVRALLAGPTKAERSRGFASVYLGLPNAEQVAPLLQYFRSVTMHENGTVVLDFSPEALAYLNAAACIQAAAKAPIEATLRQFREVTEVQYFINGIQFDEWDA